MIYLKLNHEQYLQCTAVYLSQRDGFKPCKRKNSNYNLKGHYFNANDEFYFNAHTLSKHADQAFKRLFTTHFFNRIAELDNSTN